MSESISSKFEGLRNSFPSLSRLHEATGRQVAYLDGPAGSQVPLSVIEAISDYYLHHNANSAGNFATSRETNLILHEALEAACDWFGGNDVSECFFGANMTTITLSVSRALSRTWNRGDRILVTQLDHDGNVTPWHLAAKDVGAICDTVQVNVPEATLNEDDFRKKLMGGVKLVAFTAASNSVGTCNSIARLTELAHEHGAEVYVDAVHWAPHRLIDVLKWNVDYCVCSAYKFFGPHVGLFWGRKNRLQDLVPYKLRASPSVGPGKWMTGTQNFAAIAGVKAAIDYMASIGQLSKGAHDGLGRRDKLRLAFELVESYERGLLKQLMSGLKAIPSVTVFGITEESRFDQRVPTVVFDVAGFTSSEVTNLLGERGIFCWHGHYYAIDICHALGQAERGMVRVGILHTNTSEEIERLLNALREIAALAKPQ
ncbi:MAG: cysteine desulfurase-like protein [Pirellula sp.]|jgi:cysteine desulfurase family protein (TIGR01976 family)|nr:cysteine desulfurase-like protein [Pirellula sp.]